MVVTLALKSALGLVTVVAVDIILTARKAEAKGFKTSIAAANSSRGRWLNPGPAYHFFVILSKTFGVSHRT